MSAWVSGLFVYPVKSCRGIALDEAQVGARGILWDREWMVVNRDGQMLTQRTHPLLAQIATELVFEEEEDVLILSVPGRRSLRVSLGDNGGLPRKRVHVWRDAVWATIEGGWAGPWISDTIGTECELVRIEAEHARRSSDGSALIRFQDGYPFLVIGQASLADCNRRIIDHGSTPVPMERFRPNIVVASREPHEEDRWTRVRIGDVMFEGATPCVRCPVTTRDQTTGDRDPQQEPLRTLATYRKTDEGVTFGRNFVHRTNGVIRIGDVVEVLA